MVSSRRGASQSSYRVDVIGANGYLSAGGWPIGPSPRAATG